MYRNSRRKSKPDATYCYKMSISQVDLQETLRSHPNICTVTAIGDDNMITRLVIQPPMSLNQVHHRTYLLSLM
jgi:hypothetical protein